MTHQIFSEEKRIDRGFFKMSFSYVWDETQGEVPVILITKETEEK